MSHCFTNTILCSYEIIILETFEHITFILQNIASERVLLKYMHSHTVHVFKHKYASSLVINTWF